MGSLTQDQLNSSNDMSNGVNHSSDGYKVTEERLGTPRHLRVVMVGAGASGLNTARHMAIHMENFDLTIYEKNADVGGTWFENRCVPPSIGFFLILTSPADTPDVPVIFQVTTINLPGKQIQSGVTCKCVR